jgi:hypothetical protein
MKNLFIFVAFVILAIFLGGCAHMPNATAGYYLAQSQVRFKVVRTVACDDKNNPIVANSTTPIVIHSADTQQFVPIKLADLKGTFSDTDVKLEFFEDGRLKGVNATNTGQGEVILKTIVTIAAGVVALDGRKEECDFIKTAGGGKPLTLTYEGAIDITKTVHDKQAIFPDTTSNFYAEKLENAIGHVCAVVEGTEIPAKEPLKYEAQAGDVLLKAQQPGFVKIKVMAGGMEDCQADVVWQGKLPVAQVGKSYSLPIPAPSIFGKQVFEASFSESGALNSVQYANNTGASQVLNVTSSTLSALQGETTAQKAANVKAEADLIAQQQRLVQCLAVPENCK